MQRPGTAQISKRLFGANYLLAEYCMLQMKYIYIYSQNNTTTARCFTADTNFQKRLLRPCPHMAWQPQY